MHHLNLHSMNWAIGSPLQSITAGEHCKERVDVFMSVHRKRRSYYAGENADY